MLALCSEDEAGNREPTRTVEIRVDTEGPAVSIGAPAGERHEHGEEIAVDISAADGVSGVRETRAWLNGTEVVDGERVTRTQPGLNTFVVESRDVAGTVTRATHTFTVAFVPGELLFPVSLAPPASVGEAWNAGRALPIKFTVLDAAGRRTADAIATVEVRKGRAVVAQGVAVVQYDRAGLPFYMFHWKTVKGAVGVYDIRVTLNDGVTVMARSVAPGNRGRAVPRPARYPVPRMRCVACDPVSDRWLRFERPARVLVAREPSEVPRVLAAAEQAAREGLYAVGFVAYEASPAFDRAFVVRDDARVPRALFGLFRSAEEAPPALLTPATRGLRVEGLALEVDRARYRAAVERIRELIAAGETYQVNFTARFRGTLRGDVEELFRSLYTAQPSPHAAFVAHERLAIASASPELFFERHGERLVSRPMKGTAARGCDEGEDALAAAALARSAKDRAENAMITDMVRNDVGRVARPGSVRVTRAFAVERYPTVLQMVSEVEGRTPASLPEVFAALFPPASITGAPKASATRFIAALEPSARGVYTGAIGVVAPGPVPRARFSVAIRTAVVDTATGELEYGAGGGIVYDSDADREYDELVLKARVLDAVGAPFDLLETMRVEPDGSIPLLEDHLARLARSARHLGFAEPDLDRLRRDAERLRATAFPEPRVARLIVDRAGRSRWELRPLSSSPMPEPVRLRLARDPVDSRDCLLRHKTTARERYERARASVGDCDDVILFNERGEVTETTRANLFLRVNGELVTPPVRCGLLPGVMRGRLLASGAARERVVRVDELGRVAEVFVANAVRGLARAVLLT